MAGEMVTAIADSRMSKGVISATVHKCDCCERQLSHVDKWEPGKRWHSGTCERGDAVVAFHICESCEDAGFSPWVAALIRAERISPDYLAYVLAAFAPKAVIA